MEVFKGVAYSVNNVMKFRGTVPNSELRAVVDRLSDHVELNGAIKMGDVIMATHVLYLEDKISDTEIFMPIDKAIPSTKEFTYMQTFNLTDCLMAKHRDHPYLLPVTYTNLYREAKIAGLEVEPPFYNVFEGAVDGTWDVNDCSVSVYVAAR